MITPAYLRERAAYYRQLAEMPEMAARADDLRRLANAFQRDAEALEAAKKNDATTES